MKASEFIRVFGLDIARIAVEECPSEYELDTVELKRLIESHELVEKRGGLVKAKATLIGMSDLLKQRPVMPTLHNQFIRLKQAIADMESCQ